jgi:hypothetical protein
MPEYIKVRYLLSAAVVTGLLAFNVQAAVYKWVDKDGVTHFSQSPPPPGIEGKTITPPPAVDTQGAQKKLKETEEKLDKAHKQREDQAKEEQKKQKEMEAKAEACKQAEARLRSFQNPRVNFVDKDGTRRRATEEERQRELGKAQEYIDKNCQ